MAEGWLKEVGGCDLLKGVAREGKPTGQGLVKYTRERVDVGAGVGFPGTETLGPCTPTCRQSRPCWL